MKKRKKKGRHTPLRSHAKKGSKLVTQLGALNVTMLDFERDLLPEHLWIASLAAHYGLLKAHRPVSYT
ncbi:MAG TPA: hypothetical protein DHU55_16905, partial [Blastocatellia bacterium]|nr:hypothetical protein [Blastocatellia bacterium]